MSVDQTTISETAWHALSADECLQRLQSGSEGLSDAEAGSRRERFGENAPPERRAKGLVTIFLHQFRDPLIYILLVATVVSLAIGSYNNAAFIFAVVLLNALLGAYQEGRAERGTQALLQRLRITARVRRDGETVERDSRELVPGDVVELRSGGRVPADLRLLEARNLRTDESLLTGESTPVEKDPDAGLDEDTPLGDRVNLLHAGSSVVSGSARGVVCATGAHTELGRIAESLTEGEAQAPPLVLRLRRFTRRIAVVVLAAVLVLAAIQLGQGATLEQIFFLAVALAVSAIPAGLPVAITVAMSMGASRMAQRNVIVRRLPAVEGLGSCNLIASDKTGTLTVNQLTVRRIVLPDGSSWGVSGEGHDLEGEVESDQGRPDEEARERIERLATTAVLCNEGEIESGDEGPELRGDTVDIAFLVLGRKLGLDRASLEERRPREEMIEFESGRRYAAAFHREDGDLVAHVKGAAEKVVAMCADVDADALHEREEGLAEQGYRVLALAAGEVGEAGEEALQGLGFLGLVGLIDPVRAEVPEAVERCHSAGVRVVMITGDHPATARAIAAQTGIADRSAPVVTGADLGEADEEEGGQKDKDIAWDPDTRIFARVEPRQKTRIVAGLQAHGMLVAVTGDGVNDAPALRKAHIGVAMGESGTDVARETADLVITDDNFASIVNGIEEGRVAYDNVRKVIWLLLATGTAEVLLFFLAILSGLPLPLLPVQLLWLNLVTNGVQDVALAFERGEPGILERPPRPADQPVFDRRMIEQVLVSGIYMGLVAYGLFFYLLETAGMGTVEARNLVLLLMVLFENVHTLSCRSERRSLLRIPLGANPLLLIAVVAAQGLHIGAMFTPWLGDVLQVQPVEPGTWALLLGVAASLLVLDEVAKAVRDRFSDPGPAAA